MKSYIKKLLEDEKIYLSGVVPLRYCKINRPYLLEKAGIADGSVVMLAVPYLTEDALSPSRNISAYAVPGDYHKYFEELGKRLCKNLGRAYPENRFALFSDHSPIDERDAALRSGIGFKGDNGLIITERYSSYIFLAEIITDAFLEPDTPSNKSCLGCGMCKAACPLASGEICDCLSAVTQKKGELSQNELAAIKKHNTVWGCDICQEVCPYTKRAIESGEIFTETEYFKTDIIPCLTEDNINEMDDSRFALRAYSWRGRSTVIRNLKAGKEKNTCSD